MISSLNSLEAELFCKHRLLTSIYRPLWQIRWGGPVVTIGRLETCSPL